MGHVVGAQSRSLPISLLLLSLLVPAAASAGWGDENWGDMVWGAAAPPIPSLPVGGIVALAALLLVSTRCLLAMRRRRATRSRLDS